MAGEARRLKVAILGTGNIGTDLLVKVLRSPHLECTLFAGRNLSSPGMTKANQLGVPISDRGIDAIVAEPSSCELVFDATSAKDHARHWPILQGLGKVVVDMTPARIGQMCVPAVNLHELEGANLNMVSCGGQASIPLAHLIGQIHENVEYVEVVSSIASRSAGPATRANIDEYVETTEHALKVFAHAKKSKVILILNPAQPCIDMQTTVFARVQDPNLPALRDRVQNVITRIQQYVPGYELLVGPVIENGRIVITVRVRGLGDYLPTYAGNLDIINCAAIETAEEFGKQRRDLKPRAEGEINYVENTHQ